MELNIMQKGELPHGSSPFCQETCLLIVRSDELKFWFDQSVGVAFTFVNNIDLLGFGIQEYIEAMS